MMSMQPMPIMINKINRFLNPQGTLPKWGKTFLNYDAGKM